MSRAYLDDPRGRQSEALAHEADVLARQGSDARARELYAQAAQLEAAVALEVPLDMPQVHSALAVSAVALWLKAGRHEETQALARRFLATPPLTSDAERQLQVMAGLAALMQDIAAADRCEESAAQLVSDMRR